MKKMITMILVTIMVCSVVYIPANVTYAASDNSIVIEQNLIAGDTSKAHITRGLSMGLVAKMYDSTGKLITGDNAAMTWDVERANGELSQCVIEGRNKAYRGTGNILSHGSLYVPYTEKLGKITVKARSAKDHSLQGIYTINVTKSEYDSKDRFFYFYKGNSGATGSAPKVAEAWDKESQLYSITAPKTSYKLKGHTFAGWKDADGNLYKPGEKIIKEVYADGIIYAKWTQKLYDNLREISVYKKSGTSLKVSWNKVKNANGYVVYRYNKSPGNYTRVQTIGQMAKTTWTDKKLKENKIYKYKIQSYRIYGGKKIYSHKSYTVTAITKSSKRGNAVKVIPNKGKITRHAGNKLKIKAKIKTTAGKIVISKRVKWYSTNQKVATVTKSGSIKMKSKGTCYVYAKAHNGKNSKKVQVTVQ